MGFRRKREDDAPVAEQAFDADSALHTPDESGEPAPTSPAALPTPDQIGSVGVAIMPGVPLPDWIERQSLAEALVPVGGALPPQSAPMGSEFGYAPPAAVPAFPPGTPLPAPDPAHRSEQPLGPVVWGPVPQAAPQPTVPAGMIPGQSPAPAGAVPAQASAPAMETPAYAAATADPNAPWFSPEPVSGGGVPGPPSSAGQYGWLFEPDAEGSTPAGAYERLPDYAPPPAWPGAGPGAPGDGGSAAPIPPPPQGFYVPDPRATTRADSAVQIPPPPEGFYIPAAAPVQTDSAVPIPPPPQGFFIPTPDGSPPGAVVPDPPEARSQETLAAGTADTDESTDTPSRNRIPLVFGIILLCTIAAALVALFVTPGLLVAPREPVAGVLVAPATAAGLTRQAEPARGPATAFQGWSRASGSGGTITGYEGDGVEATVWTAPDPGYDPTFTFNQYLVAGGPETGREVQYPPGPRGGRLDCAAVDPTRTVCFWGNDWMRGGADISGLGRSAAAGLVAEMRREIEQPPSA